MKEILKDLKDMIGPILFELIQIISSLKNSLGIRDKELPGNLNQMKFNFENSHFEEEVNKFAFSALKIIEKKAT